MSTPNLAISHVAESQNQKEVTVNSGLDLLDAALAGLTTIVMTNANKTLTGTEALQALVINLTVGSLSATRNVICPNNKKLYVVINTTTGAQDIVFKTSAGTGITVTNGSTKILYCDGTNVIAIT